MEIKGVNLGNWLVLEKWMNRSLFSGTDAEDEYYLPRRLPREVYEARIQTHRDEYITERDFARIRSFGLNAVRIPVPYFVFGDREPFIGCIQELDKAFCWAEKYGLKILIDLHTAPGGQNGFDNGGICGVCKWSQIPEEVDFVFSVLQRLAQRYGNREGLFGIEILNEPILEQNWEKMNVQARYIPVDQQMAEGSNGHPLSFIKQFYQDAYDVLRTYMSADKYVVFHDCFELTIWKDFMREEKYQNVVLDTHLYLMGPDELGCERTADSYAKCIRESYGNAVAEMQQYFPVIVGEWCLSNALCTKKREASMSAEEKKAIYQDIARAQLDAWKNGSGYFFWSYKLLLDLTNRTDEVGSEGWDMGRCIDEGWLQKEWL
ncbi:MAG: glycoside hydrolase family 5 protein [Fusicatenibacter sp.]